MYSKIRGILALKMYNGAQTACAQRCVLTRFRPNSVKTLSLPQLPGRLFSPSDKSKKLSHHFLLHFPIGMGSYDHHAKYQGVFMDLL
jgi:hypothetical protein